MKSAYNIAQITAEIQTIDDQFESLRFEQQLRLIERRLHLCAELNAVQSITCSMPPEILSHIIHTLIQDPSTHLTIAPTLFCVGAVCTHWRRTVWTSPQLWSVIQLVWPALVIDDSYAPLKNMVPFAQLFYKNSGSLPVDLSLFSSRWDPTAEQAEELMKIILKNGKRLRSLFVTSLTPTFSASFIRLAYTELPLLETVNVRWDHCPDHEDSRSLFCHAPRLSCLHMTLPDNIFTDKLFSFKIPSNQLTTLHLRGFNPTHALYMLSLCPLLVEFDYSCERSPTGLPNRIGTLRVPVTLTLLERLRWSILKTWLHEEVDGFLLKRFAFPSLQELTWGAVIDDMEIEDCEPFFACIENSLKVLNCYRAQTWKSLDIWKKFDHISELRLSIDRRNSPGFKFSDGVKSLECLTLQPNQVNLLPRLRSLYISFTFSFLFAVSGGGDGYKNESSLEFTIICLLYSRRRTAIDVDLVDDFISLDFDPNSDHWQHYQRLEEFHFEFSDEADGDRKFDWDDFDDYIGEFDEVTRDAKFKRTLLSSFDVMW
ncbi:hypothetical protein Agabi119p4_6738 [Agaricus bisporus var. burnettii]|uniref:F-box domain-containing protein n=1 Tax=Agaricus bisporus var. burnettii TaxID=192524 RepID=A0A8H7CBU9_AGABI|nr:hypothetical protein Agabi119p4_6738 [Agaricus bisporus var. burnettii]